MVAGMARRRCAGLGATRFPPLLEDGCDACNESRGPYTLCTEYLIEESRDRRDSAMPVPAPSRRLLDRACERQFVSVRVSHVKIPLAPLGVPWDCGIESFFFKVRPECVHVRNMENEPSPPTRRITQFQIEDGRLRILCSKRRETCSFSAIEKLHAQNISIEPHGLLHVRNSKSHCGNLFDRRRHTVSSLRQAASTTNCRLDCTILKGYYSVENMIGGIIRRGGTVHA
jgi:hypothetical protein